MALPPRCAQFYPVMVERESLCRIVGGSQALEQPVRASLPGAFEGVGWLWVRSGLSHFRAQVNRCVLSDRPA